MVFGKFCSLLLVILIIPTEQNAITLPLPKPAGSLVNTGPAAIQMAGH